eukprot:CAMPEP_0116071082 /NCGR_PEP_ID=MMETSP0322-20121206/13502_1 /TAXON_ID=163516 /ORGANISM="Leptocylindrus danicus var. apora, Strain B651" /LENGTH=87 /DNA_ID=CAMNT_0003559231 /DNA_START=536 /DNA_END=797 /DNA_ORIENTATION=+
MSICFTSIDFIPIVITTNLAFTALPLAPVHINQLYALELELALNELDCEADPLKLLDCELLSEEFPLPEELNELEDDEDDDPLISPE